MTDAGARAVTHSLWALERLVLADLYQVGWGEGGAGAGAGGG